MPEMTTSFRWTADETRRAVLLGFSALTAMNVCRRLIRDHRIQRGEALAGIAAIVFLLQEFGRGTKDGAVEAAPEPAGETVAP